MRFARAFGGWADLPGQFDGPWEVNHPSNCRFGLTIVRGLLVVSEGGRLQVLTPKGVPLQVIELGTSLSGMCADEQRVWVTDDRNCVLGLLVLQA